MGRHSVLILDDLAIAEMFTRPGQVGRWSAKLGHEVEDLAKLKAPKRSGRMAAGIESRFLQSEALETQLAITAPSPALWVHEGTADPEVESIFGRPNLIFRDSRSGLPVGKKYVIPGAKTQGRNKKGRFTRARFGGGKRGVRGQHANPFLQEAMDEVMAARGI